jgi:hypothetical protein
MGFRSFNFPVIQMSAFSGLDLNKSSLNLA